MPGGVVAGAGAGVGAVGAVEGAGAGAGDSFARLKVHCSEWTRRCKGLSKLAPHEGHKWHAGMETELIFLEG